MSEEDVVVSEKLKASFGEYIEKMSMEGVRLSHNLGIQLLIWLVLGNGIAAKTILDHAFSAQIHFYLPARLAVGCFALGMIFAVAMAMLIYFLNGKALKMVANFSGELMAGTEMTVSRMKEFAEPQEQVSKDMNKFSLVLAAVSGVFFLCGISVVLFFF